MAPSDPNFPPPDELTLRRQAADCLRGHAAELAGAALVGLSTDISQRPDVAPLGESLARLLIHAVRNGDCDARGGDVIGLAAFAERLGLGPAELFPAVYRLSQEAVDELGRDASIGHASPAWLLVSQYARRAAFDLLAAWTIRALELPSSPAITDGLTTLHTRVMFDTVLVKECQRAERFEHWLSVLLIEVSDLADINRTRGHLVGDQVLERLGILIRRYFRQHDWVARYGDHAVAVLLPETGPEDAQTLAGLMRTMVHERLAVDDERQRPVTVSVAVASARPLSGYPVDPDRILDELDAALAQSEGDRTRIECVEIHPVIAPDESRAQP
jgi:diguanylate cyclase (GGDEF)-like protein